MPSRSPRSVVALSLLAWVSLVVGACATPAAPTNVAQDPAAAPAVPNEQRAVDAGAAPAIAPGAAAPAPANLVEAPNPIPVAPGDPIWGSPLAPVTIVAFSDFQCPFCARGAATVAELEKRFGPETLRVVWKNLPLAFHDRAKPAAEAAMAVHARLGSEGFWSFHDKLFANPRALREQDLVQHARDVGVKDTEAFARDLATHAFAARVEADLRLAGELGANGTPAFFVNGVSLVGAQPLPAFEALVTRELAKAKERLAAGTRPERLYAAMVAANYAQPKAGRDEDEEPVDTTVYAVPIGRSAVRGAADAPVTLIAFGDFQCPFCKRAAGTIEALRARYGQSLRVVWKHEPLGFHPQAEPAAELAEEARAQKGDAGFWAAHDALFALERVTSEAILALEPKLALKPGSVEAAIKTKRHAAAIDADEADAEAFEANGTPHFFVNGRRVVGAQPEQAFVAIIDEELAKARALQAKGVKDVYGAILRDGKPGKDFEQKAVAPPTGAEPSRGGAQAKVVITQFSDFQCPFCARVEPTITQLLELYGPRVKLVWRNLPLPMHPDAPLAAEAALEAHRQKGNDGFWAMHEKLFASKDLSPEALRRFAKEGGLDLAAFDAALRDRRHKAAVDRDAAIAEAAGIRGTPAFVINGRFVPGAQPLKKLRRAVERALEATR